MFAQSCKKGLEGIISKQRDAPYVAGRQRSWLKTKCIKRQEFLILGYSAARSGERALGALYLGYREKGELRYAGKVGTGFSMESAKDLAGRLAKLAIKKPVLTREETDLPAHEWASARWVKPVLVCEVAFTEVD
jgi:bifunctional non-homologous end joining protein LigD